MTSMLTITAGMWGRSAATRVGALMLLTGAAFAVSGCSSRPAMPWCLDSGEQTDCAYTSYTQCMASQRGVGGSCFQNPGPVGSERRRPRR